jgi:hypothetical protein
LMKADRQLDAPADRRRRVAARFLSKMGHGRSLSFLGLGRPRFPTASENKQARVTPQDAGKRSHTIAQSWVYLWSTWPIRP